MAKTIGVFAHIVNEHNQVLCVRHAYGKQLWTTPGGRVEENESLTDALIREVEEETNLKIKVTEFIGCYDKPYCNDIVFAFHASVDAAKEWQANEEISHMEWFAFNSLPQPMNPNTLMRIQDGFAGKKAILRIMDESGGSQEC